MKLVNYRLKNDFSLNRIGIMRDDKVIDLSKGYAQMKLKENNLASIGVFPSDPDQFYSNGKAILEEAKKIDAFLQKEPPEYQYKKEEVVIGPPVPNPSKIICVGTNYAEHIAEMKGVVPDYPVLFAKFNNALIGPEDSIYKTDQTEKLDYEAELGVVIGQKASNVKQEDVFEYIAGYTIANDISARDLQKRTLQWLQGKSLDHTTPIGPYIVTVDDIPNPNQLNIKSYVNGEMRQSSNTKHQIFNIPHIVSFISELITLEPGDIILTGTPDGVGMGMNPPTYLKLGDKVRVEIEGIGMMENEVVAPRQ
ncbi:fumarylacetoacetate hydrolase family protein [Gracilibacillus dipsosauri]|uniref:FAA hydrolase family protein n=1 Tax=Gracilibacillus dipsosauri TaxID=178340 RepID=A0A317L1J7_9BACI|nr:fumarylacetoacetate hydrolase family protein [Gracilibacillus dipsosauri]PWU69682.1 FAA hydrolase family protein [Gracilibacillus dipsosauri]